MRGAEPVSSLPRVGMEVTVERPETPAPPPPPSAAVARCGVLVIDDDAAIRAVVRDALELDGYRVTTAADGAAGLVALETLAPCVVLLDMRMPVLDGWEFSRLYRDGDEHAAPIVVMTAAENARRWCAEIGGDDCLSKPFDLAELYGLVAGYCGRPA
ncbi:MAG: hypothetical protein QOF58_2436 [Pseudonocardiales bacterium]|nr:hypothetical protein [Pseudonocardiales bacterium]